MVVVTGSWVKNAVSYPSSGDLITPPKMSARAVLICRANSHPFQERTLTLDQPVKIGRSVARARAVAYNAIFDCKVLSRNHALLWYENGKFYLQDTKSSNGTFVNNQRLSKNAEESVPREVCSRDIVQFGVDVMENSKKVTHGCIVATLKLYLPDGKEAKPCPPIASINSGTVPLEDLYQLNQYLQEALLREQQLDKKLCSLQTLVESTRLATDLGWKALIDEDRLLSRVEILENQLQVSSKNFAEDKMREELRKLQEDKCTYQGSAKESLRQILQEKLDAMQKLQTLEQSLNNTETECAHLKKLCERSQQDLQELSAKYTQQVQKMEEQTAKLQQIEEQNQEAVKRLEQEKRELENELQERECTNLNLLEQVERLEQENGTSPPTSTEKNALDDLDNINAPVTATDVILNRIGDEKQKEEFRAIADTYKEETDELRYQLRQQEDALVESRLLVNQLRLQLEDVGTEEESTLENQLQLQGRLDDIEAELRRGNDAQIDNNKEATSADQDNILKAEKAKLEELLEETREKKTLTELQKNQYQNDLDLARKKAMNTMEEANVLKQQLQSALNEMAVKNNAVHELQSKMAWLETTANDAKNQLDKMHSSYAAQYQRAERNEVEVTSLRKQLKDSQQTTTKTSHELDVLRERLLAISAEANDMKRRLSVSADLENKVLTLQAECTALQNENIRLKPYAVLNQRLNEALGTSNKAIADLKSQLSSSPDESTDTASLEASVTETGPIHIEGDLELGLLDGSQETIVEQPEDPELRLTQEQLIVLQEELVAVKESYLRCNEANTYLASEITRLTTENEQLAQQNIVVPLHYLLAMVAIAICVYLIAERIM